MTSLSVLQSSLLYLYHLYQLWLLEKETSNYTPFLTLGFESICRGFGSSMFSWLFFTFPDEGFRSLPWRFTSLSFLNFLECGFKFICRRFGSLSLFLQNLHFSLMDSNPYLMDSNPLRDGF